MIVLGRIVSPHGVQGWLKLHSFGDDPLDWADMPQWWISPDAEALPEAWRPVALKGLRQQGKGLIVAFDEVPDRSAAEAIDGWYVGAPRDALPKPAKDEYYWGDLVGLDVVNTKGESLGTVASLLSTGAHDVLQVMAGETERLIPFVGAYIGKVDVAGGRINVDWELDW